MKNKLKHFCLLITLFCLSCSSLLAQWKIKEVSSQGDIHVIIRVDPPGVICPRDSSQCSIIAIGKNFFRYNEERHYETKFSSQITSVAKKDNDPTKLLIQDAEGNVYIDYIVYDAAHPCFGRDSIVLFGLVYTSYSGSFFKLVGDALFCLQGGHIQSSHDLGSTWTPDMTGMGTAFVNDIATDPNSNFVYAGTSTGLFKQDTSSGTTWSAVSSFPGTYCNSVYVDPTGRIVACGPTVCISTDHGATWSRDTAGIGTLSLSGFTCDAYGNLYGITGGPTNKLYKNTGGTGTWTEIDGGLNSISVNPIKINSVSADSFLWAATSFGLYETTDQGTTWIESDTALPDAQGRSIVKTNTGRLVSAYTMGVYNSDPPYSGVWTKTFPSAGYYNGFDVYMDNTNNVVYMQNPLLNPTANFKPTLKSTDNGNTWVTDTAGEGQIAVSDYYVDSIGTQHASSSNPGSLLWAKPYGGAWSLDTLGLSHGNGVLRLADDNRGYIYLAGYYNGTKAIYRRPITGGAWILDTAGYGYNHIRRISGGGGTVAGTDYTNLYKRSGNKWINIPLPAADSTFSIYSLAVDRNGAIYIALTNYNSTLNYMEGKGVYFTIDSGTTWTYAGLYGNNVNYMKSFGDSTFVLTDANYGYILNEQPADTSTSVKSIPGHANATASLLKAYPNPLEATSTIAYAVPEDAFVSIKIYDMSGKEVCTAVNAKLQAGSYTYVWSASALPKGMYYCNMKVTGGVHSYNEAKKLIYR